VRSVLLALPAKEPAHGYELKQALEQTFGSVHPSPNIGQIYVTLDFFTKLARLRLQADLEWLERCQEALT
jgi:DNA-binding PadR family transcriptional regulator